MIHLKCVQATEKKVQSYGGGWFARHFELKPIYGDAPIPGLTLGKVYDAELAVYNRKSWTPDYDETIRIKEFYLFNDLGEWKGYPLELFAPESVDGAVQEAQSPTA